MPTENHNYNTPGKGETDWDVPLVENATQYDRDIEIRDAEANLTDYTPKDGALFRATDSGAIYQGDGSSWTKADADVATLNAERQYSTLLSSKVNPSKVTIAQTDGETVAVGRDEILARDPDAATAINTAIEVAGSGTNIHFTEGHYDINSTISISEDIHSIQFTGMLSPHNHDAPHLDGKVGDDTVIEHQGSGITFFGIEKLCITGDGTFGDSTLVDMSNLQDCWVRDCFLMSGESGIIPGNNCWIQNNWIEYLRYGIHNNSGDAAKGYISENLFAENQYDIYCERTGNNIRQSGIINNRTQNAETFFCVEGDGVEANQNTFAFNRHLNLSSEPYYINDYAVFRDNIIMGDSLHGDGTTGKFFIQAGGAEIVDSLLLDCLVKNIEDSSAVNNEAGFLEVRLYGDGTGT